MRHYLQGNVSHIAKGGAALLAALTLGGCQQPLATSGLSVAQGYEVKGGKFDSIVVLDTSITPKADRISLSNDNDPTISGREEDESRYYAPPATKGQCYGVFVNDTTVLTSAHCVDFFNINNNVDPYPQVTDKAGNKIKPANIFFSGYFKDAVNASETNRADGLSLAVIVYPEGTAGKLGITEFLTVSISEPANGEATYLTGSLAGDRSRLGSGRTYIDGLNTENGTFRVQANVVAFDDGLEVAKRNVADTGAPILNAHQEVVGIINKSSGANLASENHVLLTHRFSRVHLRDAILCVRKPCAQNFKGSGIRPLEPESGVYQLTEGVSRCPFLKVDFETNPKTGMLASVKVRGLGNEQCEAYRADFNRCTHNVCSEDKHCDTFEMTPLGMVFTTRGVRYVYRPYTGKDRDMLLGGWVDTAPVRQEDQKAGIPTVVLDDSPSCMDKVIDGGEATQFCGYDGRKWAHFFGSHSYTEAESLCSSYGFSVPEQVDNRLKIMLSIGEEFPIWDKRSRDYSSSKEALCVCKPSAL